MGWWKTFTACALALAAVSCATQQVGPSGSKLPLSLHTDLVFLARMVSSEDVWITDGNGGQPLIGTQSTFQALDQPGSSIVAIDVICPKSDVGEKALLVFMRRASPKHRREGDENYYVYACPVVDAETIERLRNYETLFGPDPPHVLSLRRVE